MPARYEAACLRCGAVRAVKPERGIPDLCVDCRIVEQDIEELACTLGRRPTSASYKAHRAMGQMPCPACSEFVREAAERSRRRKGVKPMQEAACGTLSGRTAHAKRGEMPCDPCKAAQAAYARERNQRKRAA